MLVKETIMFNDNLGFNPFDKSNNIMDCGQKNSQENIKYSNLDISSFNDSSDTTDTIPCCGGSCHNEQDAAGDEVLNPNYEQTKLLKTVVEFLNQVSTPLYFSNNRFLSSAAKDLANKLSDHFCIG